MVFKLAISYRTEWKIGHHHIRLFGGKSHRVRAGRATLILPCIAFPRWYSWLTASLQCVGTAKYTHNFHFLDAVAAV